MKFRSTFLLLLIAGGMFAYIKFYDAKQPTTRDSLKDARKVLAFDREKINVISIKNSEGEIEIRKGDNDVWNLEKPVKDRADSLGVSGLLTAAEDLKYVEVLGEDKPVEKEQLKEFGLTGAETRVSFGGSDKPAELQFGKDAAVEGKLYAKLEGDKRVFVIPGELKNQITKKADEFRDRKLSDLTTAQVNKVVLKTAGGEIELERKNDHWSIEKPLKARGDDAKIGDLISQATTARIESFVADSANLAAFGLQEPRGTLSLYSDGREKPTVLQLGANPKEEKEKDKTYAKLSSRESVVVLPKSIETLLDTKPNDLRDKNLLRVEADIVDRINIESAGNEKIVIARKGESWVRKSDKDIAINVAAATRLLNDLKSEHVTKFEADIATDLPKYGLDAPLVKVTLSSYASENTAETIKGEKPIVTVLFGKVEGDSVYAKLEEEPFIVSLPKTILDAIPTDPLQWQDVAVYKFKGDDITSFQVSRPDQPTISVEREKDRWKLSKGDGTLSQINVQSLVNTLATLHAVRWLGATKPEHGIDKPAVTVAFTANGDINGKLTIGSMGPDGTWNATADELKGTFSVSRPDEEALILPLIDKPATPPPAQLPAAPVALPPAPAAAATEAPAAPAAPNP